MARLTPGPVSEPSNEKPPGRLDPTGKGRRFVAASLIALPEK
jgi:hypothetical protein